MALVLEKMTPRDRLERAVPSLVDHAKRVDADVARMQRAFLRLRKVFAAIQRARDVYIREQHRDNVVWQYYLKEHWRLERRRRGAWLFKLLVRSLILLVLATFRALGSGAIWLLSYSGRLILVGSSALIEHARSFLVNRGETHRTELVKLAPAVALSVGTLVTVGMFAASKSIAPVEMVLPIQPAAQERATLTAAKGKQLQERLAPMPSLRAAPGFAPAAVPMEAVVQPVPESGKDIPSITWPTNAGPAPKPNLDKRDVTPTAVPEPRPQPRAATPNPNSPKTASAPAAPQQTASAMRKPSAEKPETTSEPPQRRPTNPDRASQRRDFVPHAFW